MTRKCRFARPRLLRATAVAVGLALLLASCYSRGALDHQAASPETRPFYCNAVGDGTPPSGHGNGAHVSPIYEGMEKGSLSWDDCRELSGQLDLALNSVKDMMTLEAGEAAGWREVAEYIPGLGTHHSQGFFGGGGEGGPELPEGFLEACFPEGIPENPEDFPEDPEAFFEACFPEGLPEGFPDDLPMFDLGPFDPAEPTFLIYGADNDPQAPLVGMAYAAPGTDDPPEAFAGTNDWWHLHQKICIGPDRQILAGAEEIPDEDCEALGGRQINLGPGIWLLHLWIVPDYALKYDIFSSGQPCLGETSPLPWEDPCWEMANWDPANGPLPGTEHDEHDEHGDHEHDDDLGWSELSNGHQHDEGVEPLTEEEEAELAKQLAPTEVLMEDYPALADVEAAGYIRAGPFTPGLGSHYMPPFDQPPAGDEGALGVGATPMLIYDGVEPDSKLAGFMYMAMGDEEPAGFAGPNDHWHYHESICIKFGENGIEVPFGADRDDITEEMCDQVEGRFIDFSGYMVHVWNVPGYESPEGMFHELNPKITCPDGTYYQIPPDEWGDKDSTCLNP